MRTYLTQLALVAAAAVAAIGAHAQPAYDSDAARRLTEQMVEAHGGLERWRAAPAIATTFAIYLASLPVGGEEGPGAERSYIDNWRFFTATIEPSTSRGYVDIPTEGMPGPEAGFDGETWWGTAYRLDAGPFRDGPLQLLWCHYAMINMPFLTQLDGVSIAATGKQVIAFPRGAEELDAIRVTYETLGKPGFYDIYIDPETRLMRAWRHTAAFPALPGGVVLNAMFNGPDGAGILRIVDQHREFDGVVIPTSYTTLNAEGGVLGAHLVVDASYTDEFDAALARPPAETQIARSLPRSAQ